MAKGSNHLEDHEQWGQGFIEGQVFALKWVLNEIKNAAESELTALEHHVLRQAEEKPPMPIRVYEYKRDAVYSKLKDSPNEQEKQKCLKTAILLICSRFGVALQELVNFYLEKDFGVKFISG